jgi:hypothetical protein
MVEDVVEKELASALGATGGRTLLSEKDRL